MSMPFFAHFNRIFTWNAKQKKRKRKIVPWNLCVSFYHDRISRWQMKKMHERDFCITAQSAQQKEKNNMRKIRNDFVRNKCKEKTMKMKWEETKVGWRGCARNVVARSGNLPHDYRLRSFSVKHDIASPFTANRLHTQRNLTANIFLWPFFSIVQFSCWRKRFLLLTPLHFSLFFFFYFPFSFTTKNKNEQKFNWMFHMNRKCRRQMARKKRDENFEIDLVIKSLTRIFARRRTKIEFREKTQSQKAWFVWPYKKGEREKWKEIQFILTANTYEMSTNIFNDNGIWFPL